ncbi:RNA polymerase sigma-70 factor [Echinicola marina]|uniref:RNA polymerase sigma-70 factor n=1 Tax=Echinicola marina TaxID=2859768 RepID=UPI001CF6CCF7|nr:RNA polymerase sigma-70 factor [Echinicola marina]UCS95285.1 RNA polymerase sigma-70 factor [Echinicola marina]
MKKQSLQFFEYEDLTTFRSFFEKYFDRMFTFSLYYLKSNQVAEEVVSDVFINLWKRRHDLGEIENIEAYLYKAVKNKSLSAIQKKSRVPVFMDLDNLNVLDKAVDHFHPESSYFLNELYERLDRAVDTLPSQCKIVFKLVREDGLKYREVAEILEVSEKAIEKQMARAHKKLKPFFDDYLNDNTHKKMAKIIGGGAALWVLFMLV